MKRITIVLFGILYLVVMHAGRSSAVRSGSAGGSQATFTNQVVRILQNNCQVCHHPGDIAPFPLMTYEEAKLRAPLIKEVTEKRYMPPWKPVEGCGEFKNSRRMSDGDVATLAQWVDAGAPEGDPADMPTPRQFPDRWSLGQPDAVLDLGTDYLPDPAGSDVYRCFSIPTNFAEDRWIGSVDVKPGNRAIVHHVLLFVDRTGQSAQLDANDPGPGYTCFGGPGFSPASTQDSGEFVLGGWAPGAAPQVLPEGVAARVPAGARIVLQVHYKPNGHPETDRTQVGLYFPTQPVRKQYRTLPIANRGFLIPAGAEHHKVTATLKLPAYLDVHAVSMSPHMHLLGREMKVEAESPDGSTRCLIDIDNWDFHWQGGYQYKEALPVPGGTTIRVTAYYDNSANNPENPNSPPKDVRWGERTTDEMCLLFVGFTADLENLAAPPSRTTVRKERLLSEFLKKLDRGSSICPCGGTGR